MTANFSDLGSFVKAFISPHSCSEINISLICQSVYTLRPFAENHCAATLVLLKIAFIGYWFERRAAAG
jgi:hypothetical protein